MELPIVFALIGGGVTLAAILFKYWLDRLQADYTLEVQHKEERGKELLESYTHISRLVGYINETTGYVLVGLMSADVEKSRSALAPARERRRELHEWIRTNDTLMNGKKGYERVYINATYLELHLDWFLGNIENMLNSHVHDSRCEEACLFTNVIRHHYNEVKRLCAVVTDNAQRCINTKTIL
jgi:hypothetical protein